MLTYSGNRYSVVLGLDTQYLSDEDTFSGLESPHVIILNSNAGRAVGSRHGWPVPPLTCLMQTICIHGGYHPHPKDLFFYFVSYKKVGLLTSFSGLFGVLVGVWGCWRALVSPHVLGFEHVNQAELRLSGRAGLSG